MNQFYGYIRVSTVKQGEQGVSLEQQRDAIQRYADKNQLNINRWFEEQETAAKRGRPVFGQMLKNLKTGKAAGVIIHKIDRSARNLKDWADLGELIDSGIEVRFANESLDLHSRGGRLSADIQAVVAADYIRNLREETKKGFYGRLKQGLFPMPAPVGYLNVGKGQAKILDLQKAPLVKQAFELYSTGRLNVVELTQEMYSRGLRGRKGQRITWNGMGKILNNAFYTGLIKLKKTGDVFTGVHEPLISQALFNRVQDLLHGKVNRKSIRHEYLFRQMFVCSQHGRHLVGERQKNIVYYRCHAKDCPSRCFREDRLESAIVQQLKKLEFSQEEKNYFRPKLRQLKANNVLEQQNAIKSAELALAHVADRLNRLTDALLDGLIDEQVFQERKTALMEKRRLLEDRFKDLKENHIRISDELERVVELAGRAYLAYKVALPDEKRDLLKTLSSNRTVSNEKVLFTLATPFNHVAKRFESFNGSPARQTARVWELLIPQILTLLTNGNHRVVEAR